MALIICKTCGKRVSDTAKACVHCGEPIHIEATMPSTNTPQAKDVVNTPSETTADTMIQFKSLGKAQQEEFIRAFWETDTIAMRYQRKKLILDHLEWCLWFPLILLPCICICIALVLKFQWQSPEFFFYTLICYVFGIALFALKAFLFKIIKKTTVNRKEKRIAYEKRFSIWAKNKQIDYTPIFVKQVDEQMFEQIDIDTFKL